MDFLKSGADIASEQLTEWGAYLEKVREASTDLNSSQNATDDEVTKDDAEIEEQKNDDNWNNFNQKMNKTIKMLNIKKALTDTRLPPDLCRNST